MTQQRPIVQNVVSYGKLVIEQQLNLKFLAQKIENSRFNRKRFPALIIRKTKPKCTIMLFKTGKLIVIGSQSQLDAQLAAKKLSKDIQKGLTMKCKLAEFRITNLVANADIGYKIDLNRLADERFAVKDDSFPGVVYRNLKNIKSALIFHSGKVIFTGATLRQSVQFAFDQLKLKLKKYEKPKQMEIKYQSYTNLPSPIVKSRGKSKKQSAFTQIQDTKLQNNWK